MCFLYWWLRGTQTRNSMIDLKLETKGGEEESGEGVGKVVSCREAFSKTALVSCFSLKRV